MSAAATDPATEHQPTFQLLAADIQHRGIDTVFGLLSDDTALLVATLDAIGVRFLGARHENQAICMAEGYSSATGKLGVAVIGRGPAMTNGLHALINASRTGSQVLVIYGETSTASPSNGMGPDAKSFNERLLLEGAGVKLFRPTNPSAARSMLADAMGTARRGSVAVLLLPMDVQAAETSPAASIPAPVAQAKPSIGQGRSAAIDAAAAILRHSKKPLIIAGYGAWRSAARASIEALADTLGAAVATTLKAKDMFKGYPYNIGLIGSFSHSAARRLIEQADSVLVLGAGLNQRTSSFGTAIPGSIPLIQVDSVRTNIGRWHPVDVAIVADVNSAVEQLRSVLTTASVDRTGFHDETTRAYLSEFDPSADFNPADTARTMDPRSLVAALDRVLPKERSVVWDSGNFLGTIPFISASSPQRFKMTSDFASVGLGFGTALGFAAALPDSVTVLMIGDGGLLMSLGELETAIREELPLIIVAMNDSAYGAEMHYLKIRNMPVAKAVFADVDFAPIAEAFGFEALTIRSTADVRANAGLLQNPQGPVFLDCKINAAVPAAFVGEGVAPAKVR